MVGITYLILAFIPAALASPLPVPADNAEWLKHCPKGQHRCCATGPCFPIGQVCPFFCVRPIPTFDPVPIPIPTGPVDCCCGGGFGTAACKNVQCLAVICPNSNNN